MSVIPGPEPGSGWAAQLEVQIVRQGRSSILGRREHRGPLRIQRPFYPEGPSLLHLYLLHPPGGLVGGDRLDVSLRIERDAEALVTTPAAQKLYRSAGSESVQHNELQVEAGATLEWFPSESIAFDGAIARSRTRVRVAPSARFMGWELGCWGRPASAQPFLRGQVSQQFEIYREEGALLLERARVRGGSPALNAAWGFAGKPAFGTLYCVPERGKPLAPLLQAAREISSLEASALAVSALDEVLVARARGDTIEAVRRLLIPIWQALRPLVVGRSAELPRIWAT